MGHKYRGQVAEGSVPRVNTEWTAGVRGASHGSINSAMFYSALGIKSGIQTWRAWGCWVLGTSRRDLVLVRVCVRRCTYAGRTRTEDVNLHFANLWHTLKHARMHALACTHAHPGMHASTPWHARKHSQACTLAETQQR